jgi:hypothetical protein
MLITELDPAGGIRMFAAGLNRAGHAGIRSALQCASLGPYSLKDMAGFSEAVLVFDVGLADRLDESLADLWEEIPAAETAFIALVPREAAPAMDSSYCNPISSFLCSSEVFARFAALGIDCWARTLCFAMLRAIARGDMDVDRLLVRQIPSSRRRVYGRETAAKALVLPHRGDAAYLRAALKYARKSAGNSLTVRVGLDVDEGGEYEAFPGEYPDVEFFQFSPAPVGPYVIRQELAERSPEPLLTLQDSDDLSCYDRFATLNDALAETGCDIVGSHELCLDEIRGLVQPVRYPLDCSASLALCANHALLHATLMTHRRAFFDVGGLSTHLIIANDTQFLLRAHFKSSIRNVDEFLYIRRRHAASLTSAPETVYDNPLRRRLSSEWTGDFNAVKRGELKIEESSLRPLRRLDPWRAERMVARPGPFKTTA